MLSVVLCIQGVWCYILCAWPDCEPSLAERLDRTWLVEQRHEEPAYCKQRFNSGMCNIFLLLLLLYIRLPVLCHFLSDLQVFFYSVYPSSGKNLELFTFFLHSKVIRWAECHIYEQSYSSLLQFKIYRNLTIILVFQIYMCMNWCQCKADHYVIKKELYLCLITECYCHDLSVEFVYYTVPKK